MIIISKTPFRISFAGGGSDIENFYKFFDGKVISTSINKYIYVVVRRQVGYVETKYRINWSKTEFKNSINLINHPLAREIIRYFKIDYPIEITTFADIPANTGLASSSAFAVGLIHCFSEMLKLNLSKKKIANLAAHIEINVLKRNIGKQDHFASSYGGLNILNFKNNGETIVKKVNISTKKKKRISKYFLLIYTGTKRDANKILSRQKNLSLTQINTLQKMTEDVKKFEEVFTNKVFNPKKLGNLLNFQLKKKLNVNSSVFNKKLISMYNKIIKQNIFGTKLLGAGGGGFFLVLADKDARQKISKTFMSKNIILFDFDDSGSKIIFKEN